MGPGNLKPRAAAVFARHAVAAGKLRAGVDAAALVALALQRPGGNARGDVVVRRWIGAAAVVVGVKAALIKDKRIKLAGVVRGAVAALGARLVRIVAAAAGADCWVNLLRKNSPQGDVPALILGVWFRLVIHDHERHVRLALNRQLADADAVWFKGVPGANLFLNFGQAVRVQRQAGRQPADRLNQLVGI